MIADRGLRSGREDHERPPIPRPPPRAASAADGERLQKVARGRRRLLAPGRGVRDPGRAAAGQRPPRHRAALPRRSGARPHRARRRDREPARPSRREAARAALPHAQQAERRDLDRARPGRARERRGHGARGRARGRARVPGRPPRRGLDRPRAAHERRRTRPPPRAPELGDREGIPRRDPGGAVARGARAARQRHVPRRRRARAKAAPSARRCATSAC